MSMHADENSDGAIVPEKRPNKEGSSSAEAVEGRTWPKGNGGETAAARTLRRDTASNGLIAVRRAARQSKSLRFTALLHHITIDLLKRSYLSLERDSAPGIDDVTWQAYGENLEEKLEDLHDKVHRGSYRARPVRRTYIPKADGSKRPPVVVLKQGKAALARVAQAAQPNGTPQLGEVHPVRRPILSANQNDTPAAFSPLRRQNPREEPGALAAHAGICTVGGWQRPSLP
jgi:hypothetical protein